MKEELIRKTRILDGGTGTGKGHETGRGFNCLCAGASRGC